MNIDRLCIYTDSKFLINAMTKWMDVWRNNDWCKKDGSPLANQSDFMDLDYQMTGKKIRMKYVPAHSGDRYNDLADQLAKQGAQQDYEDRYC